MSTQNNRNVVVYIAGKYSGDIAGNIQVAREAAIKVWEAGFTAICPHLNTAFFDQDCTCTYIDYLDGDFEILKRCDAILMLENWQDSEGAKKEYEFAKYFDIPIYFTVEELRMHSLKESE